MFNQIETKVSKVGKTEDYLNMSVKNWFDNYLSFRAIKAGIKNLVKWFPIIWKDRNFDQEYLYDILYFKLGEMQKFFESGNTYAVEADKCVEQIKECKGLLKRIMNESVMDEYWDDEKGVFILPFEEIRKLEIEEKKRFWNMMCDNIDGWWD